MIRKYKTIITVTSIFLFSLFANLSLAQNQSDSLEQDFRNPPDSAKPRTWWHWTGGNISKAGITKDLEWMKRTGIAGMQLADVSFGTGQVVENKIDSRVRSGWMQSVTQLRRQTVWDWRWQYSAQQVGA